MNEKSYIMAVCTGLNMCLSVMGKEDDFIIDPYPSMGQAQFAYLSIVPPRCENLNDKVLHTYGLEQSVKCNGLSWTLSYFSMNLKRAQMNWDFEHKTSKEIFEKIFLDTNNHCGHIRTYSHSPQECDILEADQEVIERVISGNLDDKTILFIGFDQNQPTEGSEIYFNTPGYTRSIFWSKWNKRPDQNHNAIKFCFCKINEFLEENPKLINFFDYIIIGCQTREYIAPDAWIALGSMLKSEGRIVYHNYGERIDEYCGYPAFLNKMLREHCIDGENFNLYKCNDKNESIYQEISQLTLFNNKPYESADVCYANAKTLYWNKKL